jgi:hypothetical protein
MYSFGPLPKVGKSGRIIGAHQKIDRVARRHFEQYVSRAVKFPGITTILRFEGINGPDGIKLKSPGVDEPWHFIDPANQEDNQLRNDISMHIKNLAVALEANDQVRAGFEAAWLAHAVVDGLTPAHHEPDDEIFKELRESTSEKKTVRSKLVMPGNGSAKEFVKNNWEHWGAGGTMTTHTMFEAGVATTIKALKFENAVPSSNDMVRVKKEGFLVLFNEALTSVTALEMYDTYKRKGWTRKIAQQTRNVLVPIIIQTVILAWFAAYYEALRKKENKR